MKLHFDVTFENAGLNALVEESVEYDDNLTLKEVHMDLLRRADEAMLDYCDDEEDEEQNLGGTTITIANIW